MAIFYKAHFDRIKNHNIKDINITQIKTADLLVVAVYRRDVGDIQSLLNKISHLIDNDESIIIIGDMNVCNKKHPKNKLKRFLEDKEFEQIVLRPSHINGGFIDHAYICNKGQFV